MTAEATTETVFLVGGMNCSGCVGTFTRKALGIADVSAVAVELNPGGDSRVSVQHSAGVPAELIAGAIAEIGYRVVLPTQAQPTQGRSRRA